MNSDGASPRRDEKNSDEYGWLEYSLIGGLVVLGVFAFFMLFGGDLRTAFVKLLNREPAEAGPTFVVEEFEPFFEQPQDETIPVSNCGSNRTNELEVERTHQVQHTFIIDQDLDPEAAQVLEQALERHYGFAQQEIESQSYKLRMSLGPDSAAEYLVRWQQRWVEGEIVVTWPDERIDRVPYRALLAMDFIFLDSRDLPCTP